MGVAEDGGEDERAAREDEEAEPEGDASAAGHGGHIGRRAALPRRLGVALISFMRHPGFPRSRVDKAPSGRDAKSSSVSRPGKRPSPLRSRRPPPGEAP